MITFSYQARDTTGRIVSGVQEALNEENAVTALMSRGLMVLSLQRKAIASRSRKKTWTVKETDLVLCTRQLATMIEAGISLVQALTTLYEQADPKKQAGLRRVVGEVSALVRRGDATLGLRYDSDPHPDVVSTKIYDEPMVAVCSARHRLARVGRVDPKRLAGERWITFPPRSGAAHEPYSNWL